MYNIENFVVTFLLILIILLLFRKNCLQIKMVPCKRYNFPPCLWQNEKIGIEVKR
jgi:hypothetical protein